MPATEPFVDIIARAINSMIRLEPIHVKIGDRLARLAGALEDEAAALVGALLSDLCDKLVGKQTAGIIRRVVQRYGVSQSELQQAYSALLSQSQSFTYAVNTVLAAIHRSNPDLKILLVFDQFERASESAWWTLLDIIRGMPERFYVLAAFRIEAESIPKNIEKLILEASRIEGVRVRELQGLDTDEIAEWIRLERNRILLPPQLSRIKRNSGGFPIVLAPWIRWSATLDPDELRGADSCKGVYEEIKRRVTEQELDLPVAEFLHQLSVLYSPPPMECDPKAYEKLLGVSSTAVTEYSELLARRWLFDGNRDRPWFRHELIKTCIEESLFPSERDELHQKAAAFYQRLLKARRGREAPFSVELGYAYHLHNARKYADSFRCNISLAASAERAGQLDIAEQCYRWASEDAKGPKDETTAMLARSRWAGILMTWGRLDQAKAIYKEACNYYKKKDREHEVGMSLHNIGLIEQQQGNYGEAKRLYRESLEIEKKHGDQAGVSTSLHQLGVLAEDQGELSEAERFYRQALKIDRRRGDQAGLCLSFHQLGNVARHRGNYHEAEDLYTKSLKIGRRLGDQARASRTLHQLGVVAKDRGKLVEAEHFYEQSLEIKRRLGDQAGVSKTLHQLGIIAQDRKHYDKAEDLYEQSLEMDRRLGDQAGVSISFHQLGVLAEAQGRPEDAERFCRQSLKIKRKLRDEEGTAISLDHLGMLFVSRGRLADAENCVSEALAISTRIGNERMQEQASRDLEVIRKKLAANKG
jgi:tetratricopeptide (TPR) repeat protein